MRNAHVAYFLEMKQRKFFGRFLRNLTS